MSHTLHRMGTPENLDDDYVVFGMSAKGLNEAGSAPKLRRFLEIALSHNPLNYGDMKTGNSLTTSPAGIMDGIQDVSIVHAVFADEGSVTALLRDLRAEDLGISIVVSGLFDRVGACADRAGLRQHTVECSLGIWGRMDKLPGTGVLQITTMCGHGMVGAGLVEHLAGQIRRGKLTVEEAAQQLALPCVCGVFNPHRAALLLTHLVREGRSGMPPEPGQTIPSA
jgi:hypothetical protein